MKVCQTCSRRYPDNAIRCPEDGQPLVDLGTASLPREDSLVGRRMFGDYVIEKKLGEGGMGSVYLAKHTSIDQAIAIKVLHGKAAQQSELIQRFNREARVIAKLTHPNIIRVFIFGRTPEGLIYLAMEYVDGKSLRQLLESSGRLSEPHAIYIVKQVLGAVAEAHDLGVVHRDLKPENILLTSYRGNDEFVKVVDFGIAKVKEPDGAQQQQLTQAGVVYGTPDYLSPEQAQARPIDARSDIYSAGIVLWEMLTGELPYQGDTAMAVLIQHAFDPPPNPDEANVPISPRMKDILRKCMAKDPNARYSSAQGLLDALADCERDLQQSGAFKHARDIPNQKTELWSPPPGFTEYAQQMVAEHAAPPSTPPTAPPAQPGTQHGYYQQGQPVQPGSSHPGNSQPPHGYAQGPAHLMGSHSAYPQYQQPGEVTAGRRIVMTIIVVGVGLLAAMLVAIMLMR